MKPAVCVRSSTRCFRWSRPEMRTSAWKLEISSARSSSKSRDASVVDVDAPEGRLRGYPSLRGDGGLAAAQDVLLDLAGRGLRQLLDEGDAVGRLEMGEPFPDELDELAIARRGARLEDDEGVRRLAPLLVLHADDADFLHGRVPHQRAFDFDR